MEIPQLKKKYRQAHAKMLESLGATIIDWRKYRAHCKRCLRCFPDRNGTLVEMKLSFEQLWKIWQDSGHYHERGPFKGQYVMSRKNDLGSYEIGNVEIRLSSDNDSEAALRDKHPTHVARAYASRRKIPREDLEKMCKLSLSIDELAKLYKCSKNTVGGIISKYKRGLPLFKGSPTIPIE
jgi:hypothetical protein